MFTMDVSEQPITQVKALILLVANPEPAHLPKRETIPPANEKLTFIG
jgi:hypothetical protein